MSKKKNIQSENNEDVLDFESFQALWKIMSARAYKTVDVNFTNYLLQTQCFAEQFFFSHLQLEREQLIEFGFTDDLRKALQSIKMQDSLESILFVGANYAFHQHENLMKQAYEAGLELYMTYSKDDDAIKEAVKKKYEGQSDLYAQKILDYIPDEIYVSRIGAIIKSFKGFTKDEKKYLKYGLTTKQGLDESMVFDIANLYVNYIKDVNDMGDIE